MRVGTPKEVKNREFRVGLTPAAARELTQHGNEVWIETKAGAAIGYSDDAYIAVGCKIAKNAEELFDRAELIVKVKEPQPQEIARLKPSHTLFTYLHLAPDPVQAKALMKSGATCIAYETVTDRNGRLPLLTPMSEVAGRLAIQTGCKLLEIAEGGSGLLLGGVTGVAPARVLIIGGGVAGSNAAQMAVGLGADVTILDRSSDRLRELNDYFHGRARALYSTTAAVDEEIAQADLVVGAVLLPGAAAPKVVTRQQLKHMKPASVLVDISIDQGGCFETSRPTSHDDPIYLVDGIRHYCVTNMPAAVAKTSTQALVNATLPFAMALAGKGAKQAMADDPHLAAGLNVAGGKIAHPEVAKALEGKLS